jgi:plastocyanin
LVFLIQAGSHWNSTFEVLWLQKISIFTQHKTEVKMKRFGITILCAMALFAIGFTAYFLITNSHSNNISRVEAAVQDDVSDSATVSFGAWKTSPALDRFPNSSPTMTANLFALSPKRVTIKTGGTVNFIISGFHQVIVYDRRTKLSDINTNLRIAPTGPGGFPPILIDDPNNRIYRGLDPSLLPQDRVEVVHFDEPGLYLVICGVLPHFQQGQWGYVRVVASNGNDNQE